MARKDHVVFLVPASSETVVFNVLISGTMSYNSETFMLNCTILRSWKLPFLCVYFWGVSGWQLHKNSQDIEGFADVIQGYNRPYAHNRDFLYDLHCYDTTGIRLVYDDCWNSPRTTDIIIRNRDESSRINGRRFSVYDSFGGNELFDEYSDIYDTNELISPLGFGLHCFDTTGIRIQYDDCWRSPKTRNLLLTGKVTDTKVNSRRFGVASTYYGGNSLVSILDEVEDCHCVTEDRYYGDNRGILYVKMRPEYQFTTEIRTKLLSLNWVDLDGCVPYDAVVVPTLPYISPGRGFPY